MNYDLVVINGDSFSEGNGLYRQFDTYKEECKYYDYWLDLKKYDNNEVFLDRAFSWGLKIAELLGVPLLNISKSGSSNKSILRRWYHLCGITPLNNQYFISDHRSGDDKWVLLDPTHKRTTKFQVKDFSNFKNPLCITQWSSAFRTDMTFKSLCYSMNPGMGSIQLAEEWLKSYNIPIDPVKFYTFFEYYNNLVLTDYLVNYDTINNLMAFKCLMDSNSFESFSVAHRMADTMKFEYPNHINNVLPLDQTLEIEKKTYTLKDVGIDNLHYSLEGHEYFGESILNIIKDKLNK